MYGIDLDAFKDIYSRRQARLEGWPRRFLFVGRYAPEKGIDVLMEAYALYRKRVPDPWPLTCCGRGPMQRLLEGAEGVTNRGFVQPKEQAEVWEEHGVFVLGSRFDPWPLVIAEACAAGLPVICTEACGSSVELVRAHYNGLSVATDNAAALATAMQWSHERYSELPLQGDRSRNFAAAYSAGITAERWLQMFTGLCSADAG